MKNEDWEKKLTPEQYRILRQKGTEAPFSGKLLHNKERGSYTCAACGAELFSSKTKFDSGTGWPSFYDVAKTGAVRLEEDNSLGAPSSELSRPSRPSGREATSAEGGQRENLLPGTRRTEAVCANCGGHLGHVFDDGPEPTGKRYCINSVCLDFKPKK